MGSEPSFSPLCRQTGTLRFSGSTMPEVPRLLGQSVPLQGSFPPLPCALEGGRLAEDARQMGIDVEGSEWAWR